MVDARTRLARTSRRRCGSTSAPLVFRQSVPRSVRLAEAPSHGLPAIAYDRRSAGADAYWKVAMELVERALTDAASAAASRCSSAASRPARVELLELPVDAIHANPKQPRKRFDGEAGSGLAESVRSQGVIQPLIVRPRDAGGYEIVAGERRWRAAREAGLATVPAVVRATDDRDTLLLGLIENVAREQLTPVEEARACAVLIDEFGCRSARSRSASAARSRRCRIASACSTCPTTCSACSSAAS